MVQGLKFLSKKGFNPQNRVNRTKVWQREQENKQEQTRIKKREEELEREREDEELAIARGDTPRLRFMYEQPPGMVAPAEKALTKSQPNPLFSNFHSCNILSRRSGFYRSVDRSQIIIIIIMQAVALQIYFFGWLRLLLPRAPVSILAAPLFKQILNFFHLATGLISHMLEFRQDLSSVHLVNASFL